MKKKAMWSLNKLIEKNVPQTCLKNNKWVPCRPENYKPIYCNLFRRIRYAWYVITGKCETFIWPEDEYYFNELNNKEKK